jgi:hypothetical protein
VCSVVDEIVWYAFYGTDTVDSADIMGSAGGEDAQAGEEGMHDVITPPGNMRRSSGSYRVLAMVA